jgi:hypothetical protein
MATHAAITTMDIHVGEVVNYIDYWELTQRPNFKIVIPSLNRPEELCLTTLALLRSHGVALSDVGVFITPSTLAEHDAPEWSRYLAALTTRHDAGSLAAWCEGAREANGESDGVGGRRLHDHHERHSDGYLSETKTEAKWPTILVTYEEGVTVSFGPSCSRCNGCRCVHGLVRQPHAQRWPDESQEPDQSNVWVCWTGISAGCCCPRIGNNAV